MALQTIAQAWSSAEPEVDARARAAGLDHAEAGELARWSAFARWICGPATPVTFPQPQLSGAVTPSVSPFLVSARQPVTAGGGSARFASRIAVKALSPSWRNTLKNSFANSASAAVGSAAGSTVELQNGLVSHLSNLGMSFGQPATLGLGGMRPSNTPSAFFPACLIGCLPFDLHTANTSSTLTFGQADGFGPCTSLLVSSGSSGTGMGFGRFAAGKVSFGGAAAGANGGAVTRSAGFGGSAQQAHPTVGAFNQAFTQARK